VQALYSAVLGRGLSARTVRYVHAVVHRALGQAVRWDLIPRNPADGVQLPRLHRREMTVLSPDQVQVFLEAARSRALGVLFAFALATGMRPEEYLALRWSDLDLDAHTAVVRRVLEQPRGGGYRWAEPKTAQSRRTVPLPAGLLPLIERHRDIQDADRRRVGDRWHTLDLLFCTRYGTPLGMRNVSRAFHQIVADAGLPAMRLYDLRHTCATLLLATGENPKVVAERLGHATIAMTLDTYSAVLPTMQKQAADRLNATLFAG
jgi:integrase